MEVDAMDETTRNYRPQTGDRVEITGHQVGRGNRTGEILEAIGEPGEMHLRVRWEDGHESVIYPSSDVVVRPRLVAPERKS